MKVPRAFCIAGIGIMVAGPAQSAWQIRLSAHQCEAIYRFEAGYVRLFENAGTRRYRVDNYADVEPNAPMLEVHLDDPTYDELRRGWDGRYDYPPRAGQVDGPSEEPKLRTRLFPDDGEGFSDVAWHVVPTDYGRTWAWLDFDLHERFKRWGTAKETADDPGVRIPEVRMILSWEIERYQPDLLRGFIWELAGAEFPDVADVATTYYLEIPLWRTSNMMNKMQRCSEMLEQ